MIVMKELIWINWRQKLSFEWKKKSNKRSFSVGGLNVEKSIGRAAEIFLSFYQHRLCTESVYAAADQKREPQTILFGLDDRSEESPWLLFIPPMMNRSQVWKDELIVLPLLCVWLCGWIARRIEGIIICLSKERLLSSHIHSFIH